MSGDGFPASGPIESARPSDDGGMDQQPRTSPEYWWCTTCRSRVNVVTGPVVPLCAACGAVPLGGVRGEGDAVVWVLPAPAVCAGAGRHRLVPDRVKVGFRSCPCGAPGGGHSTWRCAECGDEQEAPACLLPPTVRGRLHLGGEGGRVASDLGTDDESRPAPNP